MPKYGVISVGEGNSYGHRNQEVLFRLRDADVTVYRPDMQGHIFAVSDKKRVTFTTRRTAKGPPIPQRTIPQTLTPETCGL